MPRRRRIVILLDERESEAQTRLYRIWYCAQHWEAQGIEVHWLYGVARPVDADLVIPQVDRSVLPASYRQFLDAQPRVLNRRVTDVRKLVFSANMVGADDPYDGPVIVKTAANYGGRPEQRLAKRLPPHRRVAIALAALGRRAGKVLRTGSLARLAHADGLDPESYPVYPSPRALPRGVFRNRDLVVEKFRPERDGALYCLRSYTFLGDRALTARTRSAHPIVKGSGGDRVELIAVEPAIVAARERLGFDYGKFDYVVHAGEPMLLDVNPTPSFGRVYDAAARQRIAAELAAGITRWLPHA
jgi:hypothetical protein